jgi:hypothetical protein
MINVQSKSAFAIASAILAAILSPSRAFPISISATAQGSLTPPTALFPNTVTNGDFLISASNDPLVGDGQEERTTWTFDFTEDPNFSALATAATLTSAKLTLTLTTCCNIETDELRIQTLPLIETEIIQGLPRNTTQTIELELLDFYSTTDILGVLSQGIGGTIPMSYFDDSLISFARLELSDDRLQSVPEPSLMLGFLALGAIGAVSKKRN